MQELFEWPAGWRVLERTEADHIRTELHRELHSSHPLFGKCVTALAGRTDRDDVLFQVHQGSFLFVEVHLTWTVETDGQFPWTTFYHRFDDWLARQNQPDDD